MKAVRIIIVASLFIIVALIIVVSIPISRSLTAKNSKKYLGETLIKMGKNWYEDIYYVQVINNLGVDGIKKYKSSGITVSLETLKTGVTENDKLYKEFKNPLTKESCDPYETKVYIFPDEPYNKDSYHIEYKLVCGFDN